MNTLVAKLTPKSKAGKAIAVFLICMIAAIYFFKTGEIIGSALAKVLK
ncbi:hypothetical protein [Fulvivirga ligni]|nr:hypothetical protein [Fulvivirga ligni]UII22490.1 hypothetical protein LVD16_04510 [Fulvivirga ligni]